VPFNVEWFSGDLAAARIGAALGRAVADEPCCSVRARHEQNGEQQHAAGRGAVAERSHCSRPLPVLSHHPCVPSLRNPHPPQLTLNPSFVG